MILTFKFVFVISTISRCTQWHINKPTPAFVSEYSVKKFHQPSHGVE